MGSWLGVATEGLRPTGGTCPPPDLPDPRDAPLERGGLIDMRAGKTLFCTNRRRSETCRGQLSRFLRMLVGLSGCARRGKKSRSDGFRRLDQAFAIIDPKFLNFKSDDDVLEEGSVSPLPPASSTVDDSGASPLGPSTAEMPLGPSPLHNAPHMDGVLSDAEIERRVDAALGPLYPPPPPAPYTDGAPGASLWNPDVDVVSIDTVHPQDLPLAADVLSLSCVLAQRTRDISHCYADDTHDTFIAKPSRLSEDNTLPVPPPSLGTEAWDITSPYVYITLVLMPTNRRKIQRRRQNQLHFTHGQ
jgi:hypothetical protein